MNTERKYELEGRNEYNPNCLLDTLMEKLGARNDTALARKLNIENRVLTMLRQGTLSISASMMLWFQEASGMGMDELRSLLKDRRAKCRLSFC